jgi:protein-S-isoprenylcysteine O-methyltransferase Ste14
MASGFKNAPQWVRDIGQAAYKYRQHLQLIVLAAALFAGQPLATAQDERILIGLSIALVLLGGGLRTWAMGYHVWRRPKAGREKRKLITAGPYSLSRNPLYLGTFMIGLGIAAMSGRLWLLGAFGLLFVIFHYCIIRWEEGRLIQEFGSEFEDYWFTVPRLFPGVKLGAPESARSRPRAGTFSFPAMIRCMEPVKTLGFIGVILFMALMKTKGWTLGQ